MISLERKAKRGADKVLGNYIGSTSSSRHPGNVENGTVARIGIGEEHVLRLTKDSGAVLVKTIADRVNAFAAEDAAEDPDRYIPYVDRKRATERAAAAWLRKLADEIEETTP